MTKSILIVGVGGQGTILAGNIFSKGLSLAGYEVKVSEIVGMSQRGGSVATQIRYGKAVDSPVIELGSCDAMLSFEKMEAIRSIPYLKKNAKIIVNDLERNPLPVAIGKIGYPQKIQEYLQNRFECVFISAEKAARELGNAKTMNVVLLGSFVESLGIEEVDWDSVIRKCVKTQFVELNISAFNLGRELYKSIR